jgi:hypothetical protein
MVVKIVLQQAAYLNTVQCEGLGVVGLILFLQEEAGVVVDAHQHCQDEEEGHHHTAH